jgi:hypothetical protein
MIWVQPSEGRGKTPDWWVGKIDKLCETVENLKDDRKWVTRLVIR